MEVLLQYFTGENGPALQLLAIAVTLVVCLALIVWIVKRVLGTNSPKSARGRVRRISISDSTVVDDKRHLVLVRRDNVEHLVMIGGSSDLVIEQGIVRVEPVAIPTEPTAAAINREPANEQSEKSTPASTTNKTPTAKPMPKTEAVAEPTVAPKDPDTAPTKEMIAPAAAAIGAAAVAGVTQEIAPEIEEPAPTEATQSAEAALEQIVAEQVENLDVSEVQVEPPVPEPAAVEVPVSEDTATPQVTSEPQVIIAEAASENPIPANAEPVVEISEPTPELTPNLEDTITQQLDDALSSETFDAPAATESPLAPAQNGSMESDDEMQRLLDELAGEAKQEA